jgi:glycerate kinase
VEDPLSRTISSEYGLSHDGSTGFIEMAKASGLQLLTPTERNPLNTTSYGTGQLILHALRRGVGKIILGVGGSATNDAGIGMARALGYIFEFAKAELQPIGKNLIHLTAIKRDLVEPLVGKCAFTVLCDVKNPLAGKNGAAYVFGAQKGAGKIEIELLDKGLLQFQSVAEKEFGINIDFPGAGAAGGMGAGAKAFLGADLKNGFDFLADFVHLEDAIRKADLVITGEGSIDEQSLSGKVIQGVTGLASRHCKRCVAFAGKSDLPAGAVKSLKLSALIPLQNDQTSGEESMARAYPLLAERAFHYFHSES